MSGSGVEIIGALPLARDLEIAATRLPLGTRTIVHANGDVLRDVWRGNAKASARKHGKRYPLAITAEDLPTYAGATVIVGPEESKRQGGMGVGFELGSINQPPHLDGKRAAEVVGPKMLGELEAYFTGAVL